jgi:hypothetical protein
LAQCLLMAERAGGHRRFGGSRLARPRTAPHNSTQSRIDPPAAGRCDGCHAAASGSSAPTTSRSTRFSHDDTARAWPLTAKAAAGMATSWRTGRQHLNQDTEHRARQTAVSQPSDRLPDSHRRAGPRHRMPLGRHLPTAPGQRSPGRLRATRCLCGQPAWSLAAQPGLASVQLLDPVLGIGLTSVQAGALPDARVAGLRGHSGTVCRVT